MISSVFPYFRVAQYALGKDTSDFGNAKTGLEKIVEIFHRFMHSGTDFVGEDCHFSGSMFQV